MPAILVTPKMKSGLPKPVHSALPIPQAHISARMSQNGSPKLTHATLVPLKPQLSRKHSQKTSPTAKETSPDSQIYTDWANYYLAKSGQTRLIRDLQQDVADGVLLAEIIQVLANEKIADINGYPESRSQMIENIDACLSFLAAKGVNIKGLCAEEILGGNLKVILGLFFSLSRYKQQQHQHAIVKETKSESQATLPSALHTPYAATCPLHRDEQLHASTSVTNAGEDMQSRKPSRGKSLDLSVASKGNTRLPCPSVPSRRSSSSNRRSQSFNHRDEAKIQMLACSQHTEKNPPSIMVDQELPSSPVPSISATTSTKGWRSKSLSAKHSATSSILSIKQSASASLETLPNVLAQKSMLDKLKLFNSRPSSQASSVASMESSDVLKPEMDQQVVGLAHPEGNRRSMTQSPKLALKGIAQKTLGRTLVPKIKSGEKDKGKQKVKEKTTKQSFGVDQDQLREESEDTRTETHAEIRKFSLIPKGNKGNHNAKKEGSSQTGIPKPGQTGKSLGMAKTLPSGKGEHGRGCKAGAAVTLHRCSVESNTLSFSSNLVPLQEQSQSSNSTTVKLPQTQHNHPNMATVAPFYRSQTDMNTTGVIEGAERRKERSIHTSLESLTGEDSESRRLRTVKNIADLRQNLEETMSSLRHVTSISHSTLQTTFDTCITTEFSDRGSFGLGPRPASTFQWRPSVSSPRLQAGDEPSLAAGYGSNRAEMLEMISTANTGYVSDVDILRKSVRTESIASGYMTDGGLNVHTRRLTLAQQSTDTHTPLHCKSHIDSWDDSSSVSSGISDALDTDELNTSSSLSSYITTPSAPHRNLEEKLQTDAEKRCAIEHSWKSDDLRHPDGCSDPGTEMDANSKWCSSSDFSGESERSLTGLKTHTISQTGSWRRGMSAQLGVTSPRTKSQTSTNCSPLKIHSNGKTDDAKVSEKSRFSIQIPANESKKLPTTSSTHIPTNTFGFKKTSSMAVVTSSGAIITSGSATVGKIPKSVGFASTRLLSQQKSVDDGYLPPSARTTLQYRSLPRPSRSSSGMGTGRSTGRSIDASIISKGTATLPNSKSRSLVRCSANQTDREKGVRSDTESLVLGSPHKASGSTESHSSRQAGGKGSDLSSPTLRRMFGSKLGNKQATSENLKNSTVISNPHVSSSQKGSALEAPTVMSRGSSGVPYGENLAHLQSSTSNDSMKMSLGKEEVLSMCPDRIGTIRTGHSDRYAHLSQGRGTEDARDRLNSHPCSVPQDLPVSAPFSAVSALSSPSSSATRFNFNTMGSPTAAATLRPSANSDGPLDPHADARLRNSSLCLVEKNRTMTSSGSFREALEEVHGSSLSLVSNTSSVYSTPEEKSQSEIRKLRRELEASQEKVSTLTTQLSANAHLVAAFEQSLGNMTIRLQSLTTTAEQKDTELNELRKTIELLKKQNSATQAAINGVINTPETPSKDSLPGSPPLALDLQMQRQPSSDSVSSITSHSSLELDVNSKKKRKNWLRSSFKQAFGKKKSPKSASSHSDVEEMDESSVPSSPRLPYCASLLRHSHSNSLPLLFSLSFYGNGLSSNSAPIRTCSLARISECLDCETETVMQLRSELRDKEMKLTDIRLEALSSAHQLDQLRESVNRMQVEMEKLKAENERLKWISKGSCSSATSQASIPPSAIGLSSQTSLTESTSLDMLLEDSGDSGARKEGRHVKVVVSLDREPEWKQDCKPRDFLIGCIGVSSKTRWEVLDGVVRRLFKEYIIHVDPVTQLGLTTDSVLSYSIGDVQRTSEADTPELLPCGYLVGDSDTISVKLRGVEEHSEDALVFETLIPKPILQRYVSQLQEHGRLILSGPSGTGKSFLASRLAEHVVLLEGRSLEKRFIASFSVDNKSSKELRQYLSNLTDQCSSSTQGLEAPQVVILENLQHVNSLSEIFNNLLSCQHRRSPYIIGTMSQSSSSSSPNLQLHHNFRWVLCANHTEPVKGFLGRFLRRKLLETEISSRARSADLVKIVEWIPCVWQHLNCFLETHSSSDVTFGPRLFLSCPMDVEGSQVWFTDLWNYSIIPYMLEAVREGLQLFGGKAVWEDPSLWVVQSYPWTPGLQKLQCPALLQLRREDVGFDCFPRETDTPGTEGTPDRAERDPLMNMLMRLKEAAHCAGPPSDESDSQQQQ